MAIALGLLLLPCAFVFDLTGPSRWFALGCGVAGVALGAAYLASPTWRIQVITGADALEVASGERPKFRLPWAEVVRVVASPSTQTCFVDGGDPQRSLMVPGDGAPAPYAIEDSERLYQIILAHVPADRVQEVEILQTAELDQPAADEQKS